MNRLLLWVVKQVWHLIPARIRPWKLYWKATACLNTRIIMAHRDRYWGSFRSLLYGYQTCVDCGDKFSQGVACQTYGCCLPYPPTPSTEGECLSCYHGTSKPATLTVKVG